MNSTLILALSEDDLYIIENVSEDVKTCGHSASTALVDQYEDDGIYRCTELLQDLETPQTDGESGIQFLYRLVRLQRQPTRVRDVAHDRRIIMYLVKGLRSEYHSPTDTLDVLKLSRRYGNRCNIPGRKTTNGTCIRGRLHVQGIIFDPLPHHSKAYLVQGIISVQRALRKRDGLREEPQLLSQPAARLFKSMCKKASAEKSPIKGVEDSYQERVRLTCISKNLAIGPLPCRPQARRFQVGVLAEARCQWAYNKVQSKTFGSRVYSREGCGLPRDLRSDSEGDSISDAARACCL
jgi:hypothetical protein